MQTRTKIVNPCLTRNNSDGKSSSPQPQARNKIVDSGTKDLNTRSTRLLIGAQSDEAISTLKNADKDETLKQLSDVIFDHE